MAVAIKEVEAIEPQETQGSVSGAAEVCAFWKGRVALYAVLKALGIGPGDGVIAPGYTCVMVPGAILFVGARPVYADIDRATYNVVVETLEKAWDENQDRCAIKALVLQHTYGIPADVDRVISWARGRGLIVIEDCAHALGSRYRDKARSWHRVGTESDVAIFSSQWSKPVSTGLGGWAVIRDQGLAARVRRFHDRQCVSPSWREVTMLAAQVAARGLLSSPSAYWITATAYRWLSGLGIAVSTSHPKEYRGEMPWNYAKRMSGFQKWLLHRRLGDDRLEHHRRRLKRIYDEALSSMGMPIATVPAYADPVLLRYPLRVRNKNYLIEMARKRWIELGDWFNHPLHPREASAEAFAYREGQCPQGEDAAREVVNLPMHGKVTEAIALKTIDFLKQFGEF